MSARTLAFAVGVVALFASSARADNTGIVRSPAAPRTPIEPGTLDRGSVAVRIGSGIGNGPLGLGGAVVVGLGRVDLTVGLGVGPDFCIDLGELGSGCDEGETYVSAGAQAHLTRWSGFRVGVRGQFDHAIAGDEKLSIGTVALPMSRGTSRHRLVLEPTLIWPHATANAGNTDDPDVRSNGLHAGLSVGYHYVRDHIGVLLSAGVAVSPTADEAALPLAAVALVLK